MWLAYRHEDDIGAPMVSWRMHNRLDRLTAILIETVLRNDHGRNIASAAKVLEQHNVSLDTALRVLTRPWLRRQSLAAPRGCWRNEPRRP
jgi:hypothetical protein